ncbi:toxin secretion/phage lysis holin [Paenibacillus polysaccharolyticus]|uniref:Toxin secretion/phage lysis holin n=1 Tax=Paenibacillus polysaccharolyticus TaxID=582692 RepID=A0A1G5IDT8_9BACL|nr:toxin secretion/phage lysis holin [Paenibacillus polysaccharolyticus]
MSPAVSSVTAISGAVVTFAFGGWDQLLSLLAIAMAIDYVTGLAAAVRTGTGLNSNIGFWGLARKGLMLTVVLLAHRIDLIMGTDIIKGGAIYFYLVNELISITENYAKIGLPLPAKLRQAIAVLKKQEEQSSLPDREWNMPKPNSAIPSPVKEEVQSKEDVQTVQGQEKRVENGGVSSDRQLDSTKD